MELERRSSGVAKAGLATGITTTPQSTFNPIPQGNDCCCCRN